jgi:outer membrane protein assembly factor BamB
MRGIRRLGGRELELDRRDVLKASGGVVGTTALATGRATAEASGPTVYASSWDGNVYAIDADGGDNSWQFSADGEVRHGPTVVSGTVYVGSKGGTLYALDAEDGSEQWQYGVGGSRGVGSNATVVDGTVYVGAWDGDLHAVDARTGEAEWRYGAGSHVASAPSVVDGTVYVGSGRTSDPDVHAVSADRGTELWTFDTGTDGSNAGIYSSPTVTDGTVYVSGMDDVLRAMDADTGETVWQFRSGGNMSSSPTVPSPERAESDPTVYVGGWDGNVYAVATDTGEKRWAFETGDSVYSSPTFGEAVVYVGSNDGNVYALEAETGEEKWRHATNGEVTSSPTLFDGTVYVGSNDGNVYALDAETGDRRWRFETGHVVRSPTVVEEPESGHSAGTRVNLGTIGHHHVWAGGEPGGRPDPQRDPDLRLELVSASARAGRTVTVEFRLTNEGDATARGLQGYISPPSEAWSVVGEPGAFDVLPPGETDTAVVTYEVPADAEGDYEFAGLVEDEAGNEARDTVTLTVESVGGDVSADIDLVAAGESADATFSVVSNGDVPPTLDVRFLGPTDGASDPLVVSSGETVAIVDRRSTDGGVQADASLGVADDVTDGEYQLRFEVVTGDGVPVGEATVTLRVNNAPLVVEDIAGTYAGMREEGLNPGWWQTEAADEAAEALSALAPTFGDAAMESLTSTLETFAGAGSGSLATSLVTLLDQLVGILTALDTAGTGTAVQSTPLSEIREQLLLLADDTEALLETTDSEERDELFSNRRTHMEDLYDALPTYLRSVYDTSRAPGTNFGDYVAVRRVVEQLRLVLVADYAATRSWLDGDPENIALSVGEPLGYDGFDGETYSKAVDSMDVPADYGLLELDVPEEFDGYNLIVEVRASERSLDDGLTAALFADRPEPTAPSGGTALDRQGPERLEANWKNRGTGDYYLLVEAGGSLGPYEVTARLREGPLAWRSYAPSIHVDRTGWVDGPASAAGTVSGDGSEAGDPDSGPGGESDGESTDAIPPTYANAETVENEELGVAVSASDPARIATELDAGERLSVRVPASDADDVTVHVDTVDDGGLREVARAGEEGRRVVYDAESSGTYYVGVYGDDSRETVETRLSVRTGPAENERPRAILDGPPEPAARAEVKLDGRGSVDPDGSIETFEWDLDDDGEFEASGETVTHRFPEAGEATVRLRVTDNEGASDLAAATVRVQSSDITRTPTDADGGLSGWLAPGAMAATGGLYRYLLDSDDEA